MIDALSVGRTTRNVLLGQGLGLNIVGTSLLWKIWRRRSLESKPSKQVISIVPTITFFSTVVPHANTRRTYQMLSILSEARFRTKQYMEDRYSGVSSVSHEMLCNCVFCVIHSCVACSKDARACLCLLRRVRGRSCDASGYRRRGVCAYDVHQVAGGRLIAAWVFACLPCAAPEVVLYEGVYLRSNSS